MKLIIVRHAIAENRVLFAKKKRPARPKSDRFRPLTARGRKRMRQIAKGLRHLFPQVDLMATSPFARAAETADILSGFYPKARLVKLRALEPLASLRLIFSWLQKVQNLRAVMIVGHEPQLSHFISVALTGKAYPFAALKKGSVCVIEFIGKVETGRAKMVCYAQPSNLRRIGQ